MGVRINDHIAADLQGLATAEDEFQRMVHALQTELDDLDAKIQKHLSDWEGSAASAYRSAQSVWGKSAGEMAANVAWMQRIIATARGNYGNARTANLRMWRGNR